MTDKPDILEAMARAIAAQNPDMWEGDTVKWRYCTKEARAALTAALDHMWNPSHTVLLAGTEADPRVDVSEAGAFAIGVNDTADVWQAMISQLRKDTLDD